MAVDLGNGRAGSLARPGSTDPSASRSALIPRGSTRRHAVAATASAVAAIALAVAVAGRSCGIDENTPIGAVEALGQAVHADDVHSFYELLGPTTRSALDTAARRATDLAGGSRRFAPSDMIGLRQHTDMAAPRDLRVEDGGDRRAIVAGVSADGERFRLTVVRVDGRWRIELPSYRPSR